VGQEGSAETGCHTCYQDCGHWDKFSLSLSRGLIEEELVISSRVAGRGATKELTSHSSYSSGLLERK